MPYTGFDPFGPSDPSGGGLDPSLYYAISAGGRFPGDYQNVLEYLAAQSRGTAGGNPDYDVPDWLERFGKLGKLFSSHERNVRSGGEGQEPSPPGGYPYHFFSGPGASYGPPGGPLHGLVDQGRPGDPWDGADRPPYVPEDAGQPSKKGKGGGGGSFNLPLPSYQGMQQGPSFVDWQPTQPFAGSSGPTRFVGGNGPASPSSPPPAAAGVPGTGGRGGAGKGGGGGGKKGRGAGAPAGPGGPQQPGKGSLPPAGTVGAPTLDELWEMVLGRRRGDVALPGSRGPGQGLRGNIGGGVNPNNLDMGTPGWMRDPTAGVHNAGGFPGQTPFAPRPGESFDSYLTRLHDEGFDSGSIGSMVGPYGYRQTEAGGWDWGWGTGPVVGMRPDETGQEFLARGGYQFANQGGSPGAPITMDPGNLGGPSGMYHIGGGADARAGGGAGNVGPGGGGRPSAADYLAGGVFNLPAY